MYKIESVSEGAKVTIIRYGEEMSVFPGLSVTYDEVKAMNVVKGSVTYSINEKELVTLEEAKPVVPIKPVVQPVTKK